MWEFFTPKVKILLKSGLGRGKQIHVHFFAKTLLDLGRTVTWCFRVFFFFSQRGILHGDCETQNTYMILW